MYVCVRVCNVCMYVCMYVCTDLVEMQMYTNNVILLYLSYKCTIHVNNFLFLIALLRVSMFIHHPLEFLFYAKSTKLITWKFIYMVT